MPAEGICRKKKKNTPIGTTTDSRDNVWFIIDRNDIVVHEAKSTIKVLLLRLHRILILVLVE